MPISNKYKPTVLVVNGEFIDRGLIRTTLSDGGFRVVEANSGRDALQSFHRHTPDAILLDINVRGVDGFELCRKFREFSGGRFVPIVLMIAYHDLQAIAKAFSVGATDFLTKPLHLVALPFRMHYLIRAHQPVKIFQQNCLRLEEAKHIAGLVEWEWSWQQQRLYWSKELCELVGRSNGDPPLSHHEFFQYIHVGDRDRVIATVTNALENLIPYELEYRIIAHDGEVHFVIERTAVIIDDYGNPCSILGALQDASTQKHIIDESLSQAHNDALTGLPNRIMFHEQLSKIISLARRHQKTCVLMFLDVDNFKLINDKFGHQVGDAVLQNIANRLLHCIRESDHVTREPRYDVHQVARLGGDEFTIWLDDNIKMDDVTRIAQRIISEINKPMALESNRKIEVTVSVGISIYPNDGVEVDELIRHADMAMYHAKQNGKNQFCFFDPTMNAKSKLKLRLESEMQRALQQNEFFLYYQPRVSLSTRKLTTVEVLLRWKHPTHGMLLPGDFLPVAEESGLIVEIGRWVLDRAFKDFQQWQDREPCKLSINISSRELFECDFISYISKLLDQYKINPSLLLFEINNLIMDSRDRYYIKVLQGINAQGISLVMDDFFKGQLTLDVLRELNLHSIKIDKGVTEKILKNNIDSAIAKTLITLGHELNLAVVAEGVETLEQVLSLHAMGVDEIQGDFIAPPLVEKKFVQDWLSKCEELTQTNRLIHQKKPLPPLRDIR